MFGIIEVSMNIVVISTIFIYTQYFDHAKNEYSLVISVPLMDNFPSLANIWV